MNEVILYITLLLAGFILIGTEIFIPGGVLGIIGMILWISAAVLGWNRFSEPWNLLSAFALLFVGILTFIVWIRYFPKSRVGKSLSLADSTQSYKAHISDNDLAIGTVGEAISTLRPAGIAKFEGKRVDVVADGEWIEAGGAVKISSTSGGHISVVKV